MKHVLIFDRPFRLGLDVTRVVGPFDSIEAAHAWYSDASVHWSIKPPPAEVTSIFDPETERLVV